MAYLLALLSAGFYGAADFTGGLATRRAAALPVVTLCSLYPASTVLLARAFLGERLSVCQAAGVVTAHVAVSLIVGG